MDDRPDWERALDDVDEQRGCVDAHGDLVPVEAWQAHVQALRRRPAAPAAMVEPSEHEREHGHVLAFGCCRQAGPAAGGSEPPAAA